MIRQQIKYARMALITSLALFVIGSTPAAFGQGLITPNYKEADIRQIVEAVGEITGKTFIIDPRVSGQKVTMISSTPMSPEAFYEAFLSVLEVHQYAAVTSVDGVIEKSRGLERG